MNQQITRVEREKDKMMGDRPSSSQSFRKARTKSLIQLGALCEKAGLLETFGLTLGDDFQRDVHTKNQVAALFRGFLVLNEIANSEDVHLLWAQQGLAAFAAMKKKT